MCVKASLITSGVSLDAERRRARRSVLGSSSETCDDDDDDDDARTRRDAMGARVWNLSQQADFSPPGGIPIPFELSVHSDSDSESSSCQGGRSTRSSCGLRITMEKVPLRAVGNFATSLVMVEFDLGRVPRRAASLHNNRDVRRHLLLMNRHRHLLCRSTLRRHRHHPRHRLSRHHPSRHRHFHHLFSRGHSLLFRRHHHRHFHHLLRHHHRHYHHLLRRNHLPWRRCVR